MVLSILTVLYLSACVVNLPSMTSTKTPKISHAHYGHALTAWVDTPEQKGLFVAAEDIAEHIAITAIELHENILVWSNERIKATGQKIADLTGVVSEIKQSDHHANTARDSYSLVTALVDATKHLLFAGNSKDASLNMMSGAQDFKTNSESVLLRAELLVELSDFDFTVSPEDLKSRALEMRILAVQILEGDDIDSDGNIGSLADEYGLRQLRRDLSRVASAEVPPYVPVPRKYLFGLVRLDNDDWAFEKPKSTRRYGRYSY